MVCGQTCDGLYHFAFYLVNLGIPFGSQTDQVCLSQTHRCPGACGSRQSDHVIIGTFHILPTGTHGLYFGSFVSGPLPLRSLLNGPHSRVHFRESLIIRLYSEIDQIHLSSEAQCVSHHLPPVDCHTLPPIMEYYQPCHLGGVFDLTCHA